MGQAISHRILVVDDNCDAANTISDLLEIHGYHVTAAYDGATAIELAAQMKPDIVFCDLGMPGIDGYDVAKALRGMDGLEKTKVIALTAWDNPTVRAHAIEAGFHVHLVKPASFEAILGQIPSRLALRD